LQAIIRDEVYRIGREGVLNAFRHSAASAIEVEIDYADHELRIRIRDDGCGIDQRILQVGRDGHWGLSGMRERAASIGAELRIWSRVGSGTEVELAIPSRVAFCSDNSDGNSRWGRWMRRGRMGKNAQ
jgi:signal transduction histidine kinase